MKIAIVLNDVMGYPYPTIPAIGGIKYLDQINLLLSITGMCPGYIGTIKKGNFMIFTLIGKCPERHPDNTALPVYPF